MTDPKPTLARIRTLPGGNKTLAFPAPLPSGDGWLTSGGTWFPDEDVIEVYPTAVIDPENDDEVKCLMRLLGYQIDPPSGSTLSKFRTALREIADPVQDAPIVDDPESPSPPPTLDPELSAMQTVVEALEPLTRPSRRRVFAWVQDRYTSTSLFGGTVRR